MCINPCSLAAISKIQLILVASDHSNNQKKKKKNYMKIIYHLKKKQLLGMDQKALIVPGREPR